MTQVALHSFEYKLAFYSAPALLGYKPASLFSLSRQEYDLEFCAREFRRNAGWRGLQIRLICTCQNRALLLVLQENLLKKLLKDSKRRAILETYGYHRDWNMEACLSHLTNRISCSTEFPHETGIFLGYPPEDVLAFIQNRGENCKLCGFWKVYTNPEQAKRTFAIYDQCRNFLCNQLKQGKSLYQALPLADRMNAQETNRGGIYA